MGAHAQVRLEVGCFVEHRQIPGIGRVGALDGTRARIECFESVAEPVVGVRWVEVSDCRPHHLAPQTRVFWHDPDTGAWRAGRIIDRDGSTYFVRLPNRVYDLRLPMEELRVRWDRSVRNPVDVLIAGANESPYFRDARLPMLRSLLAQRGACAGISALLSSAVEIYPHQVQTALTVLSDPVPRYLLADEVGLGKTIEAGFVIRQVFLDDPTGRVAILAPDILRRQWQAELRERFFVDDFPDAVLKISSHETPERWSDYSGFDLVVVDEAHRLVQAGGPNDSPYRELAHLAHSAPRLLLLSATPVMWTQTTYLALLHLLDRDLYRWDDATAFQQRLQVRRALATAVYALDAEFESLIPSAVADIAQLIPSDPQFEKLAEAATALLTQDDELRDEARRDELTSRVEALRAHIGETYRLHRRVIRHRRHQVLRDDQDASTLPFTVRGRSKPQTIVLESVGHDAAQDALLLWQSKVGNWLRDHELLTSAVSYGQALAVLVSRADARVADLYDALRWRLHADIEAADRAGLSSAERTLLSNPDPIPAEIDVLNGVAEHDDVGAVERLAQVVLPTIESHDHVVIFCGPGRLAADLAVRLRILLDDHLVVEHTRSVGPQACEQAVRQWTDRGGALIADSTAEDGLNLQVADAVVHCRLPWSPNRLEQRLGRVDRYDGQSATPGRPASQFVLTSPEVDYSLSGAWLALLDQGFGVFAESVSALQDGIEQVLPAVWRAAVEDGPQGLVGSVHAVREQLVRERREIDSMDMLESVHESATGLRDVASSIGMLEMSWRDMDVAVSGYAGQGPGGLRLFERRSSALREPIVRFERGAVDPLMSPRLFARAGRPLPAASMRGVFNRSVALRLPGTRVFRTGNPFVDMLADVIAIDDRGQASALWRPSVNPAEEPVPYFGMDYLIEADVTPALALTTAPEAQRALRRQADRIFAPFTRRLWISADNETAVEDETLVGRLDRPYDRGRGDVNLNPDKIAMLVDLFGDRRRFAEAARQADRHARAELVRMSDLAARCEQAQERTRRSIAIAHAQARARQAAGRLLNDTESYLTEVAIADALTEALSRPTISLVSVTCLVLGDPAGVHVR